MKYLWKIQPRYPGKKLLTQIFYEQEACGKKNFQKETWGQKLTTLMWMWDGLWHGGAGRGSLWTDPLWGHHFPLFWPRPHKILVLQSGNKTHTSQDAKRGVNVAIRAPGDGRRPQGGSEGAYSAYAQVCLHLSVLGLPGTHTWWQIVEIQGAGRKEG